MPPLCRIGAWLSLSASNRADSKCRGPDCEEYRGQFTATRFYLCDDPASLPFLSSAAAPMLPPDCHCADGALSGAFFTAPVLGARAGARHRHGAGARQAHGGAPPCASWASARPAISRSTTTLLSRARWNSRAIARTLLTIILDSSCRAGR